MKRYLLIIFLIIFVSALVWAGYFYWQNLRGIGPAIKEPVEDVAEIIEKAKTGQPVEYVSDDKAGVIYKIVYHNKYD